MRIWLVLGGSCLLLASGCSRDNPAFGVGGTGESGTELGTESMPPEESGEEEAQGEESAGVCEAAPGKSGNIEVVPICTPNDEGVYDEWFVIESVAGTGSNANWRVFSCALANCEDSCDGPVVSDLVIDPVDVTQLAAPGECIHVRARQLDAGTDDCEYHTLTVEVATDQGPELLLALRVADNVGMPASPANPAAAGFNPMMKDPLSCACDEFPETCCEGMERREWQYEIGGELVPLGEQAELTLGQQDFEFHAYNAFDSGECDTPREIVWALTAL